MSFVDLPLGEAARKAAQDWVRVLVVIPRLKPVGLNETLSVTASRLVASDNSRRDPRFCYLPAENA